MDRHPAVSREERLVARKALLTRGTADIRLRDTVKAGREALPRVRAETDHAVPAGDSVRCNHRQTPRVRGHSESVPKAHACCGSAS